MILTLHFFYKLQVSACILLIEQPNKKIITRDANSSRVKKKVIKMVVLYSCAKKITLKINFRFMKMSWKKNVPKMCPGGKQRLLR